MGLEFDFNKRLIQRFTFIILILEDLNTRWGKICQLYWEWSSETCMIKLKIHDTSDEKIASEASGVVNLLSRPSLLSVFFNF